MRPETLQQAQILLSQQRWGEAERLLRAATVEYPSSALAYYLLGGVCLTTEKLAEAVTFSERSLDLDASQQYVLQNLGMAYVKLENYPRAIDAFRRASANSDLAVTATDALIRACCKGHAWDDLRKVAEGPISVFNASSPHNAADIVAGELLRLEDLSKIVMSERDTLSYSVLPLLSAALQRQVRQLLAATEEENADDLIVNVWTAHGAQYSVLEILLLVTWTIHLIVNNKVQSHKEAGIGFLERVLSNKVVAFEVLLVLL